MVIASTPFPSSPWLRSSNGTLSSEDSPDVVQRVDEGVDVGAGVVHGERGARRRRDAEALHERLRAVVAGADADLVAAEDLGHVVRVRDVEREGGERAAAV